MTLVYRCDNCGQEYATTEKVASVVHSGPDDDSVTGWVTRHFCVPGCYNPPPQPALKKRETPPDTETSG